MSERLREYVQRFPASVNFRHSHGAKEYYRGLIVGLFYAATDNGRYLHTLFPDIDGYDREYLENGVLNVSIPYNRTSGAPFCFKRPSRGAVRHTHKPNKICSRQFAPNEAVYRCEQCGYDNTCVLCRFCYNPADHVGHDVVMYLSQGSNGGTCDCGDPEAFKGLHCKSQLEAATGRDSCIGGDDALDQELQSALSLTIAFCLNYILNITHFNCLMLPWIHENVSGSAIKYELLSESSRQPPVGGFIDENSDDLWHLVLLNDENHNYTQVERVLHDAFGTSLSQATKLADEINLRGKGIVKTASAINDLLRGQQIIEKIGLKTIIVSGRDLVRQEMAEQMVWWLHRIATAFTNSAFSDTAKDIFSELLIEPGFEFSSKFPLALIGGSGDDEDIKLRCIESGLLLADNLFPTSVPTTARLNANASYWFATPHQVLVKGAPENNPVSNSRVQYLSLFHLRFDLGTRKLLDSIMLPSVVSDLNKKAVFADQLLFEIYPNLMMAYALADREELLNCLPEYTSQLLTCPATVRTLIAKKRDQSGMIGKILGPLILLMDEYLATFNETMGFKNVADITPIGYNLTVKYSTVKNAVVRGIKDLSCLFDKKEVYAPNDEATVVLGSFLTEETLVMILLFLRYFQGYWPIIKKYGDHVEHERPDFTVHVEFTIPVLLLVRNICEIVRGTPDQARVAKFLVDQALLALMPMVAPGIADFKVSREKVSFIHPINSMLSYLLQYDGAQLLTGTHIRKPFMYISDQSLRSIVLASQVKIGFWIRNGSSVATLATLYVGSHMNELTYYRDLHLNQLACCIDNPRTTLYNFLQRWELFEWYTNECDSDATVYEDRFGSIIEEFIWFVYILLTNKSSFKAANLEARTREKIRLAVSYTLIKGPMAYTKLKREIDEDSSNNPVFDTVLMEVADYLPPTGLFDSGMYRLKKEAYEGLDTINLYLDSNEFQEVSEILINHRASSKGGAKVLEPKFDDCENRFLNNHIGNFTRTREFAKLAYKLMQVSLDHSDETYMAQLLHLIHAVFLDDINAKTESNDDMLSQVFFDIPLCDLLLSIVDSSMSKFIVHKAEFLLDFLISKDEGVIDTLEASFGEAHVKEYLSKKMGNLESEADKRKRAAERRKMKVMEKFAKQRAAFLEKSDFKEDIKEDAHHSHDDVQESGRTCVVCGEEASREKTFGLFATICPQEFRKLPALNIEEARDALREWTDPEIFKRSDEYGRGFKIKEPQPSDYGRKYSFAEVVTTCGHGVHITCGSRIVQDETRYHPCPLCKAGYNLLIPSFEYARGKGGLPVELLNEAPKLTKYNQILLSVSDKKAQETLDLCGGALSSNEGSNASRSFLHHYVNLQIAQLGFASTFLKEGALEFNLLSSFSTKIADTILVYEISSRVQQDFENGACYANLLSDFPDDTKSLLKALILCRSVVILEGDDTRTHISYDLLRKNALHFWNNLEYEKLSGFFTEVVMLYFQTAESFLTVARFGFVKLFTITMYSLLMRGHSLDYAQLFRSENARLSNSKRVPVIQKLRDVGILHYPVFEGFEKEDFIEGLYFTIERCLLPYLRRMVVFKDLLTSTYAGDKEWESIDELQNLDLEILNQEYVLSSDLLCRKLCLPTLAELIEGLNCEEDDMIIESNVFDFALERSIFDIVINAKIPKFMDKGILALDYPGIVKLNNLPEDFNLCLINPNTEMSSQDFKVCLVCGGVVGNLNVSIHTNCSGQFFVFFHPRLNTLELYASMRTGPVVIRIPAPYLTEHGEIRKSHGKASLNHLRYRYINKLWLNQGLRAIVLRAFAGYGPVSIPNPNLRNLFTEESFSEDEDDDEMGDHDFYI